MASQSASSVNAAAASPSGLLPDASDVRAELARVTAESQAYRTALEAIKSSTAWRLTAIPRRLATRSSVGRGRVLRRLVRWTWWMLTPWRTAARLRFFREQAAARTALTANPPARRDATPAPVADSGVRTPLSPDQAYQDWIVAYEPLQPAPKRGAQRGEERPIAFLLVGDEPTQVARTVDSLLKQTRGGWRLVCTIRPEALQYDLRVHAVPDAAGLSRPAVLARLAQAAQADWIAVLDAGDVLAPQAVAELACAIEPEPSAAIIYSDEDEIDAAGMRLKPYFKPGWSPQLLQAFNYFGRLTLVSRDRLLAAGGFWPKDGAAMEWSANLRVAEAAGAAGLGIVRLPRVLCHRAAGGDQERPPSETREAAENRAMIKRYWAAKGLDAAVRTTSEGTQHATWRLENPPLVSVIIPSHDNVELLRTCLSGLLDQTHYDRLDVVIVENNSKAEATWEFYESLKNDGRVRIVRCDGDFNYSRVCNYGAAVARGENLLFLNNDIEVVDADWLSELVRVCSLAGVGVVGTKLRYPDGVLQHAGVVGGIHLFGLAYHSCDERVWGVFGSPNHTRNWLAIMGACQMVRREVFDLVGGFDEAYDIANSDVALCMKAHLAGWRTAYTPFADLVHHEGRTRGRSNPSGDMVRSARLLQEVDMPVDPYLHPELSGMDGALRLRGPGEPSLSEMMQINIANVTRDVVSSLGTVDLFDDSDMVRACALPGSELFWAPQDPDAIADDLSAARWVIDLLRRRADVRLRFQKPLSGGSAGAFGAWIAVDGAALGLGVSARDAVTAFLDGDLGARVLEILPQRGDVREAMPLGLVPPGRAGFARWLFNDGRSFYDLRPEEIWAFLLWAAEQPGKALERAYLLTPTWQRAVPNALTVFGAARFLAWLGERYYLRGDEAWRRDFDPAASTPPDQQIRLTYACDPRWREAHPDPFATLRQARALLEWLAGPDGGLDEAQRAWCAERLADGTPEALVQVGLNVAGHFCYPSGLKISVESLSDGVEAAGGRIVRRNVHVNPTDLPWEARFLGLEPYDATVFHIQPEPFFPDRYARALLAQRKPKAYQIAYWYWELEVAPAYWTALADEMDEVWVATEFVAGAVKTITQRPVRTLFPGLELAPFKPRSLQSFGLGDGSRFTFLFSFHMASIMERKNPLGLIAAFRRAFRPDEAVCLVLKTTSDVGHAGNIDRLRAAIGDANIQIFDQVLSSQETIALTDACDACVSLHRSEGLGLTMAEAMLLGKPVVATRYSGNLDFMSNDNSLLVDFTLTPVGIATPPYDAGSVWAEPSVEHAARCMRRVYDDRAFARALGERARQDARGNLSLAAAGRRVMARLEEIKAGQATAAGSLPPSSRPARRQVLTET